MKNRREREIFGTCIIGLLVLFLSIPAAMAVDLGFNVIMTGEDVSLVKVNTNYRGITNDTITQYEQYLLSVGQEDFYYETGGFISDYHDISVSTNLTGTRSPKSGIGATHFIENVGTGEHNDTVSCCVFGITGEGHDLTVASMAAIKPTTLDVNFVIEANRGEAGVGWVKMTNNVTTRSKSEYRGKRIVVMGQESCVRYPAGPADEVSLKKKICPWNGDGEGYPVFYPRGATNGNETVKATGYKVWRR